MSNLTKNSCHRFSLRPFTFALAIGLGIGLATKNIGVGIAIVMAFAMTSGAFGRRAKCGKIPVTDRNTK
jgi:hypothetical protein